MGMASLSKNTKFNTIRWALLMIVPIKYMVKHSNNALTILLLSVSCPSANKFSPYICSISHNQAQTYLDQLKVLDELWGKFHLNQNG